MKTTRTTVRHANSWDSQGFTIIELMIATLVFSVVLVIITFGVISFTNGYYRGINSSMTQTTAQNAIDSVSQAIQFSSKTSSPPDATNSFFCAGGKLFVYKLGVQYAGDPTSPSTGPGLYELNRPTTCAYQAPVANDGGTELLGKGMRLTTMNMSKVTTPPGAVGDVWNISMKIVYGDTDLLCIAGNGSCSSNTTLSVSQLTDPAITCKQQSGSQFCSVASFSAVAQQRVVQ